MASDTKNVKLGVCRITFGGKDLGYTKGGVDVTVTTDTHKVTVDQFGQTTVNEVILGRNCMVKAPLAETTLANLVSIMPGATLVSADNHVEVVTSVGTSLLDNASALLLHPIALPDSDTSQDFLIPKAATPGQMNFSYKLDAERIFDVTFTAYPDPATQVLFKVGAAA